MVVPDFTSPSLRFIQKGDGRQVIFTKMSAVPTAGDDPARSRFIDELLAKRAAEAND